MAFRAENGEWVPDGDDIPFTYLELQALAATIAGREGERRALKRAYRKIEHTYVALDAVRNEIFARAAKDVERWRTGRL